MVEKHSYTELGYIPRVKHMTPDWRLYRLGPLRLLVTRPNPLGYAPFVLDVVMSLCVARTEGAAVYFVRPAKNVYRHGQPRQLTRINQVVLEILCEQVTILRGAAWLDRLLRRLWGIDQSSFVLRLTRRMKSLKGGALGPNQKLTHQNVLPGTDQANRSNTATDRTPYFRRLLLRHTVPIGISERLHYEASGLAEKLGMTSTGKIVTLHARELGLDEADRRFVEGVRSAGARRNARIETYFAATDYLVSLGYTIVRIGDPTMTPVDRAGVIDLATWPSNKRGLVELYCVMKSEFMLGTSSGPGNSIVYLTDTPVLVSNGHNPIVNYPVRPTDMYILKRVLDLRTGHELSLTEMLSEEYLANCKDISKYEWIDNDGEEILRSVHEMLDLLNGRQRLSEAQMRYKLLVAEAGNAFWDKAQDKSYGPDNGFLGDGRIADWAAQRYLG